MRILVLTLMMSFLSHSAFGTEIFIKKLTTGGDIIPIDVESSDTIAIIKEKIEKKEGTPIEHQKLIYAGELMDNDKTVEDYDLFHEGGYIYLVLQSL